MSRKKQPEMVSKWESTQKQCERTILMIVAAQIFEHQCSTCSVLEWRFWGQGLILSRTCLWNFRGEPGTSCSLRHSFCQPLVTFSLFNVVSIRLLLSRFRLLRVLPLLRICRINGGRVWPEGDDDTGHVVASRPVSRRVGGQTVLQQLSGRHLGFE